MYSVDSLHISYADKDVMIEADLQEPGALWLSGFAGYIIRVSFRTASGI